MLKATNPPNVTAYSPAIRQVTGRRPAAFSFGTTGSVLGRQAGASRMTVMTSTAVSASATAMITCAATDPNQATKRGVKNADRAVPPMPAPKTPVAKPRRAGWYQALTNGMPTANVVPGNAEEEPENQQQHVRVDRPGKRHQQHRNDGDQARWR